MSENVNPIIVNMQYIRDLSLEVPLAPQIFQRINKEPKISVDLNIDAKNLTENVFDVSLNININADLDTEKLFILELSYASVCTLSVEKEDLEKTLFIEVPKLIFPYVRQIISSNTADAGLPPLVLAPIDFVKNYEARKNNIVRPN